jgi:hypothetical protein
MSDLRYSSSMDKQRTEKSAYLHHNSLSIRDLTTKDVDQYNQLLRYAFQVTEQELMEYGWESEEIKQSKFPIIERANILSRNTGNKANFICLI